MSGLRAGGTCAHLFSIGPQAGGPVCVGFREHAGLQGPGVCPPGSPVRGGRPSLTPAPPSLQAEAAVAAVAVADTVRDGSPPVGSNGASKTWGLVTPTPGTPPGGSTGPSAAASFFLRYVLLGACAWPGGGLSEAPRALSLAAYGPLRGGRAEGGSPGLLGHCVNCMSGGLLPSTGCSRGRGSPLSTPPSWVVSGRLHLVSGALCLGFLVYQVALPGGRRELMAGGPQPRPVDIPRWSWASAGRRGWVAWTGGRGRQASRQRPEGASLGHWGGWRELGRVSWGDSCCPGAPGTSPHWWCPWVPSAPCGWGSRGVMVAMSHDGWPRTSLSHQQPLRV